MAKYDESSIKNLGLIEGIKRRPSTFINKLGPQGLLKLLMELVQNANDEVGECIRSGINKNNSYEVHINSKIPEMTVIDFARGIPLGSIENLLSTMFSGAKYDENSYEVHNGGNGLALMLLVALSEYFIMEVHRDNKVAHVRYENGYKKYINIEPEKDQKNTGTTVTLKPNMDVFFGKNSGFSDYEGSYFNEAELVLMLDALSFNNPGIVIKLFYDDHKYVFKFIGTIADYMYANAKKQGIKFLIDNPCSFDVYEKERRFRANCCISFSKDQSLIWSYVNRFPSVEHGKHVDGVKSGVSRAITQYIKDNDYVPKSAKFTVTGADIIDNIVCIVQAELPNPLFDAQTKNKLTSEDYYNFISTQAYKYFTIWAKTHREEIDKICKMAIIKAKATYAAKEAKEQVMNPVSVKNIVSSKLNFKNFTDCSGNNPKENELYLCEGLSAAGALVSARDAKTQAYLALRGKILNIVGKKNPNLTEELQVLISVLGIKGRGENADYSKLRYYKIVIMTDADPDGMSISSLILGFLLTYYPKLIEDGRVFIANPPFYRLNYPKNIHINILNETYFAMYKVAIALYAFDLLDSKNKKIDKNVFKVFLNKLVGFNDYLDNYAKELNLDPNLLEIVVRSFDHLMCGKYKQFEKLGYITRLHTNKKNYRIYYFDKGYEHYFLKIDSKFFNDIYKPIYKRMCEIKLGNVKMKNKKNNEIYGGTLYHMSNCLDKALIGSKCKLDRYKGIGEMNPDVIRETSMDPKTRKLIGITIDSPIAKEAAKKWTGILLGTDDMNTKKNIFMEA